MAGFFSAFYCLTCNIISKMEIFDNRVESCSTLDQMKLIDDVTGEESEAFLGYGFDMDFLRSDPERKKKLKNVTDNSSSKKAPKITSAKRQTDGPSNTRLSIRHPFLCFDISRNIYNVNRDSDATPCDAIRVTDFDYQNELVNFYCKFRGAKDSIFTFPRGSIHETFNVDSYSIPPEIASRLPAPRHFKKSVKVDNPFGMFLGFDGGTRCKYYGSFDPERWTALQPFWDKCSAIHKETAPDFEPVRFRLQPNSEDWVFRCAGFGEKRTCGYPTDPDFGDVYVLERGGLQIYVLPPQYDCSPSLPDVVIIYGWQCFFNLVAPSAVEKVALEFLETLGFSCELDRREIQRADLQVTTNRMTVDDVRRAERSGRVVCPVRKGNDQFNRHVDCDNFGGTMYYGKRSNGTIMARVYDKGHELRSDLTRAGQRKFCTALKCLGDYYNLDRHPLTRFEFEMHKKFLDQFDIKNFDDLERKLPSVVEYLFSWFRILATSKGTRHSNRAKIDPKWAEIAETLKSVAEYYATEKGGAIKVTRKTSDERPHINPNYPKDVNRAEEFLARAVGEVLLANGVEEESILTDQIIRLVADTAVRAKEHLIRKYVRTRGEGAPKYRSFLEYPDLYFSEGQNNYDPSWASDLD